MTAAEDAALLRVEGLAVHFAARGGGTVKAVDGVSFRIGRGETLSLVGESGCGKTTVARAVIRLVRPTAGRILFDGIDLAPLGEPALRPHRPRIQMVFQDPASALDPRMTVRRILAEPLEIAGRPRAAVRARIDELLGFVGLGAQHADRYPHEFSGGQKQRIVIARALALSPDLLICDEAVSALDVSVQAQIINLLKSIQKELGIGCLFVAHDLGVVRQVSHRIAVMYLGRIVETAPRAALYARPAHPYTQALLSAVPRPVPGAARGRVVLSGEMPTPLAPPSGCRFRTRCPLAVALCAEREPPMVEVAPAQYAACHFAGRADITAAPRYAEAGRIEA